MGSVLVQAYARGYGAALLKFALAPPTTADAFAAEVDEGKDMPPPSAPGMDGMQAPPLPQDTGAPMGDPTGGMPVKDAALGLKDLLFFENALGKDEAHSLFQGIERSMSGQSRGTPQTLSFSEHGMQRTPHPSAGSRPAIPAPSAGRAALPPPISSAPPPIPAAALRPRMPGR